MIQKLKNIADRLAAECLADITTTTASEYFHGIVPYQETYSNLLYQLFIRNFTGLVAPISASDIAYITNSTESIEEEDGIITIYIYDKV